MVSQSFRHSKQITFYTGLVSCGAQFAETCSDCPLDKCSGDCTLDNAQECKKRVCTGKLKNISPD